MLGWDGPHTKHTHGMRGSGDRLIALLCPRMAALYAPCPTQLAQVLSCTRSVPGFILSLARGRSLHTICTGSKECGQLLGFSSGHMTWRLSAVAVGVAGMLAGMRGCAVVVRLGNVKTSCISCLSAQLMPP